jgi:TPR repeat protein
VGADEVGPEPDRPALAASPAPEISAAEASRKGDEAVRRKDYAEAMRWLRPAADQGNAPAQVNIGRLYYHGWGVAQDYRAAMSWYLKAVDQQDALAQYDIGLLYAKGWGCCRI